MSDDYKTLRVPEDAWETARAQKEDAGRTWGEQIVRPDGESSTPDDLVQAVEDAIEHVKFDAATGGEAVSFDDMKNACAAAIEEAFADAGDGEARLR